MADENVITEVELALKQSLEDPANVSLYQYFGYEIVGNAMFAPEYETWAFFRRDD